MSTQLPVASATANQQQGQQAPHIAAVLSNAQARPYFDASQLPTPSPAYVCWLDLLGAANAMKLSLPRAANFVGKIHVAGLQALQGLPAVRLYPVIDGFYGVCFQQQPMLDFLRTVLRSLSTTFVLENDNYHRFLVRSGLSFGPVLQGTDLAAGSNDLANTPMYSGAVALGQAIAQAYESERHASPFGVFVHESARSFAPAGTSPLPMAFWKWGRSTVPLESSLVAAMAIELEAYLNWADEHRTSVLFPTDEKPDFKSKLVHKVKEYFH